MSDDMERIEPAVLLASLLEGLEVPNLAFWLGQHPGALFELGRQIAKQAKLAYAAEHGEEEADRAGQPKKG